METTNTTQDVKTEEGIWVEIALITVPEDARKHTPEDVDSRAVSLAKEGQLENILLSKEGDQLILVYGNGRLESAKKAGWEKIRADIKEGLTETQKLLMTLAENEERENASPFYTAGLYQKLMDAEKLDVEGLAKQLGKTPATVYNYRVVAKLPAQVQENSNRFEFGLRHWLEIAKLPKPEDQVQLAQECAEKDYSVRELQARVKKLLGKEVEPKEAAPKQVKPGFHFVWEGQDLTVRGRWSGAGKGPATLAMELQEALGSFLEDNPAPEREEVSAVAA